MQKPVVQPASSALRILIYGINYAGWSTGLPKYNAEMGAWLASRGHQVDAIAGFPHYPQWRIQDEYRGRGFHVECLDGVQVHRTPLRLDSDRPVTGGRRARLETAFTMKSMRYWLPIWLQRRRYDVVLAVCPPMQTGAWPLLYRLVRRVPWVYHVQDLQVDAAVRLGMIKRGWAGKSLHAVESLILRQASAVSTISESMRERIIERGVGESVVWLFPNWADLASIRPSPADNAFRKKLGIATQSVVVMCAGSMGEKHGLESVLDAASRLRDRTEIVFLLIGAGSAKRRLEEQAVAEGLANLRFLPMQPLSRLSDVLAAGDIHLVVQRRNVADLVLPSKLTNICAAGRCCVATADRGTTLSNVVLDHDLGVVCPPEDPNELADAIGLLAGEPAARKRFGHNARHYAECELGRDQILAHFEARLRGLVSNNRPTDSQRV